MLAVICSSCELAEHMNGHGLRNLCLAVCEWWDKLLATASALGVWAESDVA